MKSEKLNEVLKKNLTKFEKKTLKNLSKENKFRKLDEIKNW